MECDYSSFSLYLRRAERTATRCKAVVLFSVLRPRESLLDKVMTEHTSADGRKHSHAFYSETIPQKSPRPGSREMPCGSAAQPCAQGHAYSIRAPLLSKAQQIQGVVTVPEALQDLSRQP